jgi:MFS family permease
MASVIETPPHTDKNRTFAALADAQYRRLFAAGTVAFLATQALVVARGWLASELTGNNTGLGGVYLVFGAGMLLATPIGGILADRLPRRNMLAGTYLLIAAVSLWMGLGIQFEFVTYWMALVAAGLQAVAFAFMVPARMSMTIDLVGRDLLTNAVVLGQMSMNATRVVGPSLAGLGIGIAWFGLAGVYFATVVLMLLALATVFTLPAGERRSEASQRSPWADYVDVVRYVGERRELRRLLTTSFVVLMVGFPYLAFLPRVSVEMFDSGASGYGVLSAVSAIGAVGVSFLLARRSAVDEIRGLQTGLGLAFGLSVIALGASPNFVTALVVLFVVGATSSGFQSMNNALVLALSHSTYHGRVMSLMMLAFGGFGLAALPLGLLADAVGLPVALMTMGAITTGAMITSVASSRRETDTPVSASA